MATLDVTDIQVIVCDAGTVVTVTGGTYTTVEGERIQVPLGATSMTITPAQWVRCMYTRKNSASEARNGLQAMATDLMREAA